MSIFDCCEREDETKYLHPCYCPSAAFYCTSESVSPTLQGVSEFSDSSAGITPSSPPKRYKKQVDDYVINNGEAKGVSITTEVEEEVGDYYIDGEGDCDYSDYWRWKEVTTRSLAECTFIESYNPTDSLCTRTLNESTLSWNENCDDNSQDPVYGDSCSGLLDISTVVSGSNPTLTVTSTTTKNQNRVVTTEQSRNDQVGTNTTFRDMVPGTGGDFLSCTDSNTTTTTTTGSFVKTFNRSITLSEEDTESDAIGRETPEEGTSCSSLSETRSNGFSWVVRTSGYTIECSNLAVGLEYEVKPVIRKRTAVIGSYGAWEDVTISPITFTATDTTKTIDNGGDPIELDHVQGYEYQITGVNIEKKA
jgi:hypothetical protein